MNGPFDRRRAPSTHAPLPVQERSSSPVLPGRSAVSRSEEDEARSSSKYRAALEALFAPKPVAAPNDPPPADRPSKKMVAVPSREDQRSPDLEKRLAKLLAAEGRTEITRAARGLAAAGFAFPEEQEVMLKLLDHEDEARVRTALESLGRLLETEPPQRRAVLESRLRRLEDDADDLELRALAGALRKRLLARAGR